VWAVGATHLGCYNSMSRSIGTGIQMACGWACVEGSRAETLRASQSKARMHVHIRGALVTPDRLGDRSRRSILACLAPQTVRSDDCAVLCSAIGNWIPSAHTVYLIKGLSMEGTTFGFRNAEQRASEKSTVEPTVMPWLCGSRSAARTLEKLVWERGLQACLA
jgi:hypothetical protein